MIFRPFFDFAHGCAAYLFGCGGQGVCAVVDAREGEIEEYVSFAADKGMRITHVIDTHVHADHRSGGPALARRVGAALLPPPAADVALAVHADRRRRRHRAGKHAHPCLAHARTHPRERLPGGHATCVAVRSPGS